MEPKLKIIALLEESGHDPKTQIHASLLAGDVTCFGLFRLLFIRKFEAFNYGLMLQASLRALRNKQLCKELCKKNCKTGEPYHYNLRHVIYAERHIKEASSI